MSETRCPKGAKHDLVHFDFGRPNSCWVCVACGELLGYSGVKPSMKQTMALTKFALENRVRRSAERKNAPSGQTIEGSMKKNAHIEAHVNGLKSAIHAVEVQVTILKQLCGLDGKASAETEEEETEELDEKPKKSAKAKKAKGFDDESEEEETETEESEEDEKPKKGKAKKVTVDDVNDACMERAGRTNRADVLGILKKNFKVKSVTDLEPSDYAQCIQLMAAKASKK